MTAIVKRQHALYIYTKQKKRQNIFIHKKPGTLQKARQFPLRFLSKNKDNLSYTILHEIFEIGICIQKA